MSSKAKVGRPKGDSPPLASAQRTALTRKRQKVYLEECKKVNVGVRSFAFDNNLFAQFEELAKGAGGQTNIEDLVFSAMAHYLELEDKPSLASHFIVEENKHVSAFGMAKLNSLIRLEEELGSKEKVREALNIKTQVKE